MLKRIDVTEPPKSAPQYMLESRIMAETGVMPKVSGRRSETPFGAPSPGSTPTRMPRRTPTTISARCCQLSTMVKPCSRASRFSTQAFLPPLPACGERAEAPLSGARLAERSEARVRGLRGALTRPLTRSASPSRPLPAGLADSHIALRGHEGGAAFGGLELEPALEHDDGSGLAVVAGPSAEAGADPCRIGERAPGVGVALSFGLAFEAFAQGFDERQVVRAEGVGDGPEAALTGAAVAGVDELLDGDGGDERRHGELAPGAVLADAHRLD